MEQMSSCGTCQERKGADHLLIPPETLLGPPPSLAGWSTSGGTSRRCLLSAEEGWSLACLTRSLAPPGGQDGFLPPSKEGFSERAVLP